MPKNEEFLKIIMEYCKWRDDGASMISDDEGFGGGSSASTSQQHQQSFINIQSGNKEADKDRSKSFVQQYEEQLKHFGMLNRWDDSQRYLSDHSHLVCEETSNYLLLWCFHLQADKKEALMEQVAHQAMAMQFILEMANSHKVDPRGCFRQFFQKAKAGEEGYLEAFTTELEAFKWRVKQHCSGEISEEVQHQKTMNRCCLDPTEVMGSSAPRAFQLQDRPILQNVQSNMNPQVAEYYVKRCIDSGLWVVPNKGAKEDTDETRMMETS